MIRGSTVYTAPELFDIYASELGKPIAIDNARAIVAALAAKYERDGYSRPQIKVDDALVAAGVLRVDVLEPRISEVRITGDPGPYRARLESLGSALRTDRPVSPADLQSTLRLMRELPGLTLTASTAQDGATPNLYRLDVDTQFKPVSGSVRLSNRGTDEAGPDFLMGQVAANGVLGGRTSLGGLFSAATDFDEYRGAGLLATVGAGKGQTSVMAFRSRSDPHEPGLDRDDTYVRDLATIGYARPLASDGPLSVTVTASLNLDDLTIARSGDLLRDERLRMLKLGSSFFWRHEARAQSAAYVEVEQALEGLGSELYAVDLPADARSDDFVLTRFSYTRLTTFSERWSVRLDTLAQQTAYVLPYGERFKIGGERLGRGFEVAEIAGDEGVGAKVEVRRGLPGASARLGRVSVYGFYDIGVAWKQDSSGRESAATAGVGFATQARRVSCAVELAQPLTHPDVEGRTDLALFAELAYSF